MKKLFGFGTLVLLAAAMTLTSCGQKDVPAESLSIEKELTLYVDSTYQLQATVTPENATGTINWTISDTAVALVSDSGLVKAIKKGSAIVTANLGNAIAACNVTVMNNPVTLELAMVNIEQKKCTVAVKPSDNEGYYYCGYAAQADVDNLNDSTMIATVMQNLQAMIDYYKQYGQTITLKDILQQGEKKLIASGLNAKTDYVMFAFGVDIETAKPAKTATRLPFKTKDVVPSSMTFTIAVDSISKVMSVSKGDTTYSYTGYFKCTPSNEKEGYTYQGATGKILDSLYNNDAMKYLTEMEAYYDANYSSSGGFEGMLVKAGARQLKASKMVHNTKYVLFAAGYQGGFTTKATVFEYTFIHPDSVKQPMPAYAPRFESIDEIKPIDFRGVYFPGVCH